jgi:hypothetical protein
MFSLPGGVGGLCEEVEMFKKETHESQVGKARSAGQDLS